MMLSKNSGELSEQALLEGIRSGDGRSFEIAFRMYYAPLVVMAMRWIRDKDSAQSIVQDVFARYWEKRTSLQITSLKSYLRVAVRNSCMNEIKHAGVVRAFEKRPVEDDVVEEYDVTEDLYAQELYLAIDELPPQRKRIFLLSRVDGKKYREIADMLSLSQKTVEAQMGKALQFLREKLVTLRTQMQGFLL